MRPLLSAHQLALAPVLFVFTCFIFRLVSAFASEAASASAPASARVGSQPSSPRAFAFSASVARVPCGLYFALLASGPAGGQPQFTFNSNGAAFNDAAAADNTSAARVHQACDLLCDAISTQQWAAHAKIESFCALLCAAFTSHQMSELASGADGAPAAVLSIEWPPLVSVDDAFAQCERVFAAAPAPTPSFALPSAALILNASYHFCRTLSYSGISASPALADRCSDALLEHHPNSGMKGQRDEFNNLPQNNAPEHLYFQIIIHFSTKSNQNRHLGRV